MTGNMMVWYGMDTAKRVMMIHEERLALWRKKNGVTDTPGESYHAQGCRYVRGPRMQRVAKSEGWMDLASELAAMGFVDEDVV